MKSNKKAMTMSTIGTAVILMLVILVAVFIASKSGSIGAEQSNQSSEGIKNNLERCLDGSTLCADEILDNRKTDSSTGGSNDK